MRCVCEVCVWCVCVCLNKLQNVRCNDKDSGIMSNHALERVWSEAAVACFHILSRYWPGSAEEPPPKRPG